MFLREAEGVYLFGQRRVMLQLDKDNQVCVKQKGNLIDIAKFIEENTMEEVKLVKRKDATSTFQNNIVSNNFNTHKTEIKHM